MQWLPLQNTKSLTLFFHLQPAVGKSALNDSKMLSGSFDTVSQFQLKIKET
jgi:hypothetical protein